MFYSAIIKLSYKKKGGFKVNKKNYIFNNEYNDKYRLLNDLLNRIAHFISTQPRTTKNDIIYNELITCLELYSLNNNHFSKLLRVATRRATVNKLRGIY